MGVSNRGCLNTMNAANFCYEIDQIYALCDRGRCFYCGCPANALDHVLPHSYLHPAGTERTYDTGVLPVCTECNSVLGSNMFDTLEERFEFLEHKMWGRYRKALDSKVRWTDRELLELSASLRGAVINKMEAQKEAQDRLENLSRRPLLSPLRKVGFDIEELERRLKPSKKDSRRQEAWSKGKTIK